MSALPWIAIFLAAVTIWSSAFRGLALGLLVAGYGVALADGQLGVETLVPIGLLCFAAYAVSPQRKRLLRYIGHALFIVLAIALSKHWLPGFHNLRAIGPERITPDAVPFSMYLNFDKPLAGFWLMLALPWIRPQFTLRGSLKAGVVGMLMTTAACLLIAVLLEAVTWAPKWPAHTGIWLLNNLLLVTFAQEVFFRGYVQEGLSRLLKERPYANVIAICIAAVLFGLDHTAGGLQWVALSSIAGVGYGVAYRFGGLRAAVLAHFGLNVLHFFLFTYPMVQPHSLT
jgi:uncharacterized protein